LGSAFLAHLFPGALRAIAYGQQGTAPAADPLAAVRAQIGAMPIQTQKLGENLTLLSGPGGNVVVLNGADGKFVVDTFLSPAWPKLKETLDGLGNAPLKTVIDTHWHFDHTDNNAPLHAAGATVLAHENTKKRMSEAHDLPVFGLHFDASPAEALPQETFASSHRLKANGESLALQHFAPAHTDSDIYILFEKGNVIHMGDTFFNGMYRQQHGREDQRDDCGVGQNPGIGQCEHQDHSRAWADGHERGSNQVSDDAGYRARPRAEIEGGGKIGGASGGGEAVCRSRRGLGQGHA
jgi:glyoxylase-like metal-dependent hydrolase (beta-lactamase superfamily II)